MNISVIYIIETQNLRLGVCLAMCLIFWQFEPGCAYKMCAYKKKCVTISGLDDIPHFKA